MAGYELSEAAVRKLAEIVRAYSAGKLTARTAPPASPRRDAPYTPEFYRLAVNAGDGAYTLRKQEWDADTDEMINLADGFDPDYNLDIDGFDYQGRADGVAGAAGTGQIVRGWRLFIDDEWITLVDVGDELRITSKDIRAAHARSTAAELAETPTKPHKIVGDNEAHLPSDPAGAGWLEAEVLGADDANQQLLIKHVGPGPLVYTGCGIELDGLGHVRRSYVGPHWIGPCA
jgi:hypothetical protein